MKDKIEAVSKINSDLAYLRAEYRLWGLRDEGVTFERLIEWLKDNEYEVNMMIKTAKAIEGL